MLRAFGCAVVVLVLVAGCGDAGPKLSPVSGKVTVNDVPLAFKTVMFHPDGQTPGAGGGGNTDKDGTYIAFANIPGATTAEQGLLPGRYRVTVIEPLFPIGEGAEVQSAESTEPVVAIAPDMNPRKRDIPRAYMQPETTPLILDVPEAGAVHDLKLTSK